MSKLNRDFFAQANFNNTLAIAKSLGIHILSEEERELSRQRFLNDHYSSEDLWVFAYGSIMWNPIIQYDATELALIEGYHRAFCMKIFFSRASHEKPGLMLALKPGGQCHGMLFRIKQAFIEEETRLLWSREMSFDSYRPVWINASVAEKNIKALTFVANTANERFVNHLDLHEQAKLIAFAEGIIETNRDYLFNTVEQLKALNIHEPELFALYEIIKSIHNKK